MDEPSGLSAVCFDMDGVVVDSERYWQRYERDELLPWALAGDPPDLDEITGMNFREIYDYLDEEYETVVSKEEFVEEFDETAEEIYLERVELLAEFRDLRAELRERGVDVALVSSSPTDWIGMVADRFELEPFDQLVSADELDVDGKPEPDVYETAAELLGREPEECVVVEDSYNGILSASRAGMYVVGFRGEANEDTDLSEADVVVESPAELREKLLELTG